MEYTGKNDATKEAYDFYNENVKPIKYFFDEKRDVWLVDGAGHNDDLDAFRHAYVSGVYTIELGKEVANLFGQANEVKGTLRGQPESEKNMDLWNNRVGRSYGEKTESKSELADLLLNALKIEELIITTNKDKDSRKYEGETQTPSVDPQKPVIVVKENETGRNELFLDLLKGSFMTRESFVSQIESGGYTGYTISNINDLPTPISKPDGVASNNLG